MTDDKLRTALVQLKDAARAYLDSDYAHWDDTESDLRRALEFADLDAASALASATDEGPLQQARLGICPVCQNRFSEEGHSFDCPLARPAVPALDKLPTATCYRTHTQPDENRGVYGAVWLADVKRALASHARPAVPALDEERLARLVVSYADLTHEVVVEGRDWREIADEWGTVVDECRTYLAALQEQPE